MSARRILIAAFGNELRGDDGFGVRVLEALGSHVAGRSDVELLYVGTGGIRLAQHLLGGYDHLIVLDAVQRQKAPGTLHVLEVEAVTGSGSVDMHMATPSKALSLARELGALPARMHIVGCEPDSVEELSFELSGAVAAQVEPAVDAVLRLLEAEAGETHPGEEVLRS